MEKYRKSALLPLAMMLLSQNLPSASPAKPKRSFTEERKAAAEAKRQRKNAKRAKGRT